MATQEMGKKLMHAANYAQFGFPHDVWTELRANEPVAWIDIENFEPFWAITKYADVAAISVNHDIFLNGPRPFVVERHLDEMTRKAPMKTLVQMDAPQHPKMRKIVSAWFTPRNLAKLEERIQVSAESLVAKMSANGQWQGDFVTEIAAYHPLDLLAALLGLDEEGAAFALKLANELFGSEDPEFRKGASVDNHLANLTMEAMRFFYQLAESRKKNPRDDLATVIANATVDDKPIDTVSMFGLMIILITAGHETTRTAMSGGLLALIENPGELQKLKQNPGLGTLAAEEIVRWTSPVNAFGRTATQDYELRGKTIKAGQTACLFYGSANRDEDVFVDPFAFHVDRDPNPHLGFGKGRHFCLGATLARMEMRTFFPVLANQLQTIQLVGRAEYLASNFVCGIKHLPVQCTF